MAVIGCTSASKASSTRLSAVSSAASITPSAARWSLIEYASLIDSPCSFSLSGAVLGTREGPAGRGVVFCMGGRPVPSSAWAAPAAAAWEEADAVALAAAPSLPGAVLVGAVLVGAVLVVRSASLAAALAWMRCVTTPCRLWSAVSPRSNAAREASAPSRAGISVSISEVCGAHDGAPPPPGAVGAHDGAGSLEALDEALDEPVFVLEEDPVAVAQAAAAQAETPHDWLPAP